MRPSPELPSCTRANTGESNSPSRNSPNSAGHNRSNGAPPIQPGTKLFLLLCVNTGPFQIKLDQVDLTHVGYDEILFCQIREAYRKMRGSLTRNPFVVPKAVEYVKVRLRVLGVHTQKGNDTDQCLIQFELVRRSKSGECVGNKEVNSIPSEKEVRAGEYAFFPCPPRIGRLPIQSHLFMHSLLNPGDHSGNLAVQQLPKKVGTKLVCTSGYMNGPAASTPSSSGWGIYIVEGPNVTLVVWLLGAGLLSIFLLTTVWATVYKDVQAGMGIGQFGLALLALMLTTAVVKESNRLPAFG